MDGTNLVLLCVLAPAIGFVGMYSGGFWGVGCAWLIIPSMLIFFDCSPMQAAGIGLLQVAPSILGTVWREASSIGWGKKSLGTNLILPMALGSFTTSFCGRPINEFFNELCGRTVLLTCFGIFMFIIGCQTVIGKGRTWGETVPKDFSWRSRAWALVGGLGAGVFSSVLGVGGAMVFRPVLVSGYKLPEIDATRSTRFLLLTTTLIGGLNYLYSSQTGIDTKVLFLSVAIAIGGAIGFPRGARGHWIVVEAGYARKAQQSFAIICFIVCLNVLFCLLGLEYVCRYLMLFLALGLLLFLHFWKEYAKKKILSEK